MDLLDRLPAALAELGATSIRDVVGTLQMKSAAPGPVLPPLPDGPSSPN